MKETFLYLKSSTSLGKWIPILGKLYHFSQERITFAKAKSTCEHNFGKLFEPKTETINNEIALRAGEKGIINPWIGIRHLHDKNITVYASDYTLVAQTKSYWDANEPNNRNGKEDCTHLYNKRSVLSIYNFKTETFSYNKYSCSYHEIGNAVCDYWNNNKECEFDGGDCCIPTLQQSGMKTDCLAKGGHYFDMKPCNYKQIGDGICNDESNTEECKWDGGDCCGIVDMSKCSACECREPSRWNDNSCEDFRRFICEKEDIG